MEKLDALLRSINPIAESYLQMHQLMQSTPAVNVKMIFMEPPTTCSGIKHLLQGQRYDVSAPEAMWRLIELSFSEKSHVGNHEVGRSLAKPTASSKKSAVIMQLQNLMPSKGLCSGLYNKANSDKTTA
ncbi:hypothetical protein AVEN_242057-1 [Araneus ventricosus]|uniref:Uncharacterized protein n=1 Tax=Araneus ventricosus TaxID=182803 RepID=A0A4Y2TPW1_ARAVE|nr:hypothetical protein AVEN_268358-1 [Araneus ventricosus]GBO01136.1 hypothetical protein AVEN_242057-1 [Araneus ventricosus]